MSDEDEPNNNNNSDAHAVTIQQIHAKCKEQADCSTQNNPDLSQDEIKKLQKKCMKQSVALASSYFRNVLQLDTSIIDVEVYLPNVNDIIDTAGHYASCLLDAGCARIVVPYHITNENTNDDDDAETLTTYQRMIQLAGIPRERLMVHIQSTPENRITEMIDVSLLERFKEDCHAISICLDDTTTKEEICTLLECTKSTPDMDIVIQLCSTHPILRVLESDAIAIGEILKSSTPKDRNTTTISIVDPTPELLGRAYAACISSDRPDQLYSTVVCTRTNEALGLVYSSITSIVAALECGRGVYYSRSRNGLWRKGDTSGHYQTLHRIDVDCDGDALRFTVTQNSPSTINITTASVTDKESHSCSTQSTPAAFCHLETLTCWGPSRGIRHLEETLQDRLHHATEGSYTQRLFHDTTLLRDKLVEEAQELAEADTPQHVAEELADVLYFSLVRAAQYGITLEDAVVELDRRARKVTRRAGDSKAFRIEAAQAILTKK
jgi:phosphoribosyl-ATP pyrophosphohydrolase/phosphoribosyl-AMP cyclohydrolase/histidinol dehydrogenase